MTRFGKKLALCKKNKVFGNFLQLQLGFGQNFEFTLAKLLCCYAHFHCLNGRILKKILSLLVSLRIVTSIRCHCHLCHTENHCDLCPLMPMWRLTILSLSLMSPYYNVDCVIKLSLPLMSTYSCHTVTLLSMWLVPVT